MLNRIFALIGFFAFFAWGGADGRFIGESRYKTWLYGIGKA